MITIGVDAHKRLHVAVALDETGHEVHRWQGGNSSADWQRFLEWVGELGPARSIGIEGTGGLGRGLTQHLVANGETVFEVNPRWTALGRRSARTAGKSDRLDAHAIAEVVRQHGGELPLVHLEDESALLNLLTNERDDLMADSIRLQNQLHALLGQIDPVYHRHFGKLTSKKALSALQSYSSTRADAASQERVASVRRLAARLAITTQQVADVSARIRSIAAARYGGLTAICGVNLLTAGTLAAILGPGGRFSSDAELAAYAGVAPLEASSAGRTRHRLNRGGNRRLNAVIWRIAVTQSRASPDAKAYIARRMSEGKTKREAFRALKRFIVRAIWNLYREIPVDLPKAAPSPA